MKLYKKIYRNNRNRSRNRGFTLLEILVVIGLIAILAAVTLIAINPGRQFALARNTERTSDVAEIANAISQNASDNKGVFSCSAGPLPTVATTIGSGIGSYDLRNCLVPLYLAEIPVDPSTGTFSSGNNYATGYQILVGSSTQRITVSAPGAELGQTITLTH